MYHDVVARGAEDTSGFRGRDAACARQVVVWNAKKMTKRFDGERYLQLRRLLLCQGDEVKWGDRPA
jgi:hypothetical protein